MRSAVSLKLVGALKRELPALAALVALVVVGFVVAPGFLSVEWRGERLYGVPIDIFKNATPVILTATGMTLVIASGAIDLSVGSTMALAGACAGLLLNRGTSPATAALCGLGAGLAVGMINAALVSGVRLQPIVATLVTLVSVRGAAQWLTDDQKIRLANPEFETLGSGAAFGIPVPVCISGLCVVIVAVIVRSTRVGMAIESVGDNREGARRCGIWVGGVGAFTFAVSGLLAAVAGMIGAADIREADVANSGLSVELDAVLAVVLGGTALTGGRARIFGTIVGAILMQTLTVLMQMKGVLTDQALVIKALVAFAAAAAQSPGVAQLFAARRLAWKVRP